MFSFEHGMSVRTRGAGAPLVWIHGLGESSTSFDPVVAHPALAAFTHVLVDLPGYGRSPWDGAPTTLAALADHLAAWLRARALAHGPAIVLGHSMGGVLATLIGERVGPGVVRAVVDIEGNLTRGDCTFSAMAAAYSPDELRARGFAAIRDQVYARGATELPLRGYHAAMCFASPDVFHAHATDLVRLSEAADLGPRLRALAIPHLYVAGVPDGICAHSRDVLARLGARWLAIEPAGHWAYLDRTDAFATAIAAFATAPGA